MNRRRLLALMAVSLLLPGGHLTSVLAAGSGNTQRFMARVAARNEARKERQKKKKEQQKKKEEEQKSTK